MQNRKGNPNFETLQNQPILDGFVRFFWMKNLTFITNAPDDKRDKSRSTIKQLFTHAFRNSNNSLLGFGRFFDPTTKEKLLISQLIKLILYHS